MRLLAPAKINLHLRVGPPRDDGFHPLLTWMCTVGLFDKLTMARTADGLVRLVCDDETVPRDHRNLVVQAAVALADSMAMHRNGSARNDFGLAIELLKRIPSGAGLGGGSSDGARVLAGLNSLWEAGWDREELARISARLGSDLPFFLYGPSAVCRGRGEIVRPVRPPTAKSALLVLPGLSCPTPAVYRQFDVMNLGQVTAIETEPDFNRWAGLPALELLPLLRNDLEPAAFVIRPELKDLRDSVEQLVGRIVRMSGSGSSFFSLFDTREEAIVAESMVSGRTNCTTVVVETAPVYHDDLNAGGPDR